MTSREIRQQADEFVKAQGCATAHSTVSRRASCPPHTDPTQCMARSKGPTQCNKESQPGSKESQPGRRACSSGQSTVTPECSDSCCSDFASEEELTNPGWKQDLVDVPKVVHE